MTQIELAFIYGSVARNEETKESDIDLFIVGDIEEDEIHQLISVAEDDIGRAINYTIMSKGEFEKRLKNQDTFVKRIVKEEKIILKGNYAFN